MKMKSNNERLDWIDNLRGGSILAIIILHLPLALNGSPGYVTKYFHLLDIILGPMRLGLMFFISGMFVDAGLKKGISIYVKNKTKSILYPFVVWAIIYASLKILFMAKSNHQQSVWNVILMHVTGGGDITWFLHSLFIFFIIIIYARKIPIIPVLLTCTVLSCLIPVIHSDSVFSSFDNGHFNKSIYLFMFFYIGDYVIRKNIRLDNLEVGSVFIVSIISFLLITLINFNFNVKYQYLSPLALASIPIFVFISQKINFKFIAFIGANSIVFYLTHYLVIQIAAKLIKINNTSPLIQDVKFFVVLIMAVAIPYFICKLRTVGFFNYLFSAK
ncbi:acyltransferase family protein [Klebsiella pneumoniae]|jgi:uncharacterized membrane protein YcfT